MKELADTGGGVLYKVERLEDLAGAMNGSWPTGTVYSLAYRPADKNRGCAASDSAAHARLQRRAQTWIRQIELLRSSL